MCCLLRVLKLGGTDDEGVPARRNQGQRNGSAASIAVAILRLQPKAEPGIGDFRLAVPEVRPQPTFDAQMIELQLNFCDVPGKEALHVDFSNENPDHPVPAA